MLFQNSKKGEIPLIKEFFTILVVSLILISWILTLFVVKTYEIDEREINTQIIQKKILSGNCFSDDYATFEKNKINKEDKIKTQDLIDDCFKGLENKNLVRFQLDDSWWYILESEKNFIDKANLCSISGTLFCTQVSYPITYILEDGSKSVKELKLQIITT